MQQFSYDLDPPDLKNKKGTRRCSLVFYDGDRKRAPNVRVASIAVRFWDANFDDFFIGSVETQQRWLPFSRSLQ